MKETMLVLGLILGTFLLMFLTSMLFQWQWIMGHWSRQAIVLLLIFVELFHGILMYLKVSQRISQKQDQ
nr:hypothetical protein [Allomuricauda sp.]